MKLTRRIHTVHAALVFTLALADQQARANPNDDQPHRGIAVYGEREIQETAKTAEKLYAEAVKQLQEMQEKIDSGGAAKIKPALFGNVRVALDQLQRLTQWLKMNGETVAIDYEYRHERLNTRLLQAVDAYLATGPGDATLSKLLAATARQEQIRDRELTGIENLAGRQQWAKAEVALYKSMDGASPILVLTKNWGFLQTYDSAARVIQEAMLQQRRKLAIAAIVKLREGTAPDVESLIKEIEGAAGGLKTSPAITVGNGQLTGPQLLGSFAEKWKALQLQMLRRRALGWAELEVREETGAVLSEPLTSQKEIEANYAQASARIVKAMAGLIAADAQRASQPEVRSLHLQYLASLSRVVPVVDGDGLRTQAEAALQALAQKDARFAQEVAAYQVVTDDILRWRSRVAQQAVRSRATSFPRLDKRLRESAASTNEWSGLFMGLNSNSGEEPEEAVLPRLLASTDEIIPVVAEKMKGQNGSTSGAFSVQPGLGIGGYVNGTYSRIELPAAPTGAITSLRNDLMLSASTPPLSLSAAVAVATASAGIYSAAGGVIDGFQIESAITRFSNLPASASSVIPLGRLPAEMRYGGWQERVIVLFDIKPNWIQHAHFFVPLPATPAG